MINFIHNIFTFNFRKKEILTEPYRLRNAILSRLNLQKRIFIKSYDMIMMSIEKILGAFWFVTSGQRPLRKVIVRKKPRILVWRPRFFANVGEEALPQKYFFGALEKRQIEVDTFFCDTERKLLGNQVDFYKKIMDSQYDSVIFYCYDSSYFTAPSLKVLKKVKKKISTQFIAIWEDTIGKLFLKKIMDTSPLFDMHVFNENPTFKDEFDLLSEDERRKVFIPPGGMYVVSPSSGLENTARERNIDVFFSGRVGSYRSYRKDTLMYLIENGVSGYINFFLSETNLDNEEYYKLLSMSKIAINFSYSNEGHQLKGRALEAISVGAMLLESENPQISCFFEDGTDYVSFSSKEDLLEKIGYYLKNSEERVRIAKNGMRKVAELYHPHNYWEKIFEKIGIDLK